MSQDLISISITQQAKNLAEGWRKYTALFHEPPVRTGTLRRSIHTDVEQVDQAGGEMSDYEKLTDRAESLSKYDRFIEDVDREEIEEWLVLEAK